MKTTSAIIIALLLIAGCGSSGSEEAAQANNTEGGWCYVIAAKHLAWNDTVLSVDEMNHYPPTAEDPKYTIETVFNDYNTDPNIELWKGSKSVTIGEIMGWLVDGYRVVIVYQSGVKILSDGLTEPLYHAEPVIDGSELDGKEWLQVWVSGDFNVILPRGPI